MKKVILSLATVLTLASAEKITMSGEDWSGTVYLPDSSIGISIGVSDNSVVYNIKNGIGIIVLPSIQESYFHSLDEAFAKFKENNINELYLDLRDNSITTLGGIDYLMDKIAGVGSDGKIHTTYKNIEGQTLYEYVNRDENSLNIKKVIVRINSNTAGGAEHFISALKPFMNVKVIGSNSAGHHYLMYKADYGSETTDTFYNTNGMTYNNNGILTDTDLKPVLTLSIGFSDNKPDNTPIQPEIGFGIVYGASNSSASYEAPEPELYMSY